MCLKSKGFSCPDCEFVDPAGHMIPIDSPRGALTMVRMIMDRHSRVVAARGAAEGGATPAAAAATRTWRLAAWLCKAVVWATGHQAQ